MNAIIVALGLTVALPVFPQEQPDAGLVEWQLQGGRHPILATRP
jgi:hypothetical protein